jgi:hypothetical protein
MAAPVDARISSISFADGDLLPEMKARAKAATYFIFILMVAISLEDRVVRIGFIRT